MRLTGYRIRPTRRVLDEIRRPSRFDYFNDRGTTEPLTGGVQRLFDLFERLLLDCRNIGQAPAL